MPPATPIASVVVASWNRAPLLARLLDALEMQDVGPFEVVVVDDASTDDTPELLAKRSATTAFTLIALRQERNQGPAAARNRGWQTSTAPIICFTDDDCIPSPGWLASLVAAADNQIDIAQGRTEPAFAQRASWGPFSMTMEKRTEDGFYETCNIAYRKEWLERLGGFDEEFRFPCGEDTDLGWRARKAGARTSFVDEAVVEHEIWPFRWKSRLGDIRRREGYIVLLGKHPELRALFPSPFFQKQTHPRALAAAASLLSLAAKPRSLPRWALAAGLLRAYFVVAKPERPNVRRRDWPWVLPLCLASDLADVTSLARASVRRGVLFL